MPHTTLFPSTTTVKRFVTSGGIHYSIRRRNDGLFQVYHDAVGTGEARHAIEADPQIRRRFDAFSLPRWTECEDFRDFICAFGKLYPLRKPSKLGERGIIQKVLNASEGITGPVTRVLVLAAIEAIRSSGEFIDEAGIEAAAARMRQNLSQVVTQDTNIRYTSSSRAPTCGTLRTIRGALDFAAITPGRNAHYFPRIVEPPAVRR